MLDFELQADTAIPLCAHEWMLRELVRNLLHNAIRHAPIGSALLVTLTLQADRQHACLRILDEGPGLPEELLQRLYQPFSAGDTRNGSGLGLAICLEIVQALHGAWSCTTATKGRTSLACKRRLACRLRQSSRPLRSPLALPPYSHFKKWLQRGFCARLTGAAPSLRRTAGVGAMH